MRVGACACAHAFNSANVQAVKSISFPSTYGISKPKWWQYKAVLSCHLRLKSWTGYKTTVPVNIQPDFSRQQKALCVNGYRSFFYYILTRWESLRLIYVASNRGRSRCRRKRKCARASKKRSPKYSDYLRKIIGISHKHLWVAHLFLSVF